MADVGTPPVVKTLADDEHPILLQERRVVQQPLPSESDVTHRREGDGREEEEEDTGNTPSSAKQITSPITDTATPTPTKDTPVTRTTESASTTTTTPEATRTDTTAAIRTATPATVAVLADGTPHLHIPLLQTLETQAGKCSDDIMYLLGNLSSSLHAISGTCVKQMEVYHQSSNKTTESVNASIFAMHSFVAKCQLLHEALPPLDDTYKEVQQIKTGLDQLEFAVHRMVQEQKRQQRILTQRQQQQQQKQQLLQQQKQRQQQQQQQQR